MKSICFLTSSRADFGSIKLLIDEIIKLKKINKIYLIITGSHNDNLFGSNFEIKVDKKIIVKRIKIKVQNKDSFSVINSFSESLTAYTNFFKKILPESIVVLGDRYEMLSAALSAYILKINIIHLAGGEKTIGSLDDGFRNCITKLANLHFPVANAYKKRIIQMGENKKTIFNYGGLHFEKIKKTLYLSKRDIEKKLNFKFLKKNILLTYHPDTIDEKATIKNLEIILKSLKNLKNTLVLITSPNSDAKGVVMINSIKLFIKKNKLKHFKFFKSLGSRNYFSILKFINGVIGNSSSGISEVPYFNIKTINLGDRQIGRISMPSIINCSITEKKIKASLKKLFVLKNKTKLKKNYFYYGNGNTSKKIARKIINFNFQIYKKKIFVDI
jgi:GDP/UDP-N,N'-diacetylbacillosamine 2-epimerase (hydrolysing)